MLNKLSLEKIEDSYIPPLIYTWLRNPSKLSEYNLNLMLDWFKQNDAIDKKIGNVYRGLHFDFDIFIDHIFQLFSNKSIRIDSRRKGFSSWSGNPNMAISFSTPNGIVLSNNLSKNSRYIDLQESNSYLESIGKGLDSSIIESECEFITDELSCDNCKLEDIEVITCSLEGYRLFRNYIAKKEEYNIIFDANLDSRNFVMIPRGKNILVQDSYKGIDFNRKPNIKCG